MHVDNCGFYENGIFCEFGNKRSILTVDDFRENGKFEKTGNWARIHQSLAKPQLR